MGVSPSLIVFPLSEEYRGLIREFLIVWIVYYIVRNITVIVQNCLAEGVK